MEDVEEEETFTGRSSFEVSDDIITEFNSGAELNMDGMSIFPNEIVELISKEDPTRSVSGIFNGKTGRVEHMPPAVRPFGLYPRSKEQSEAIALLMNNDIDYISLSGGAGSGKTILAVSCALELVIEQQRFQKLLILRNVCPAGLDVGFLPGGLEEKLAPWAGSVEDALEVMLAGKSKGKGKATKPVTIDDLKAAGVIEFQPLTYLRGRSLANTLILIEEMQDVTTADARTILSRVSRGSKVISTGCIKQIDLRGNDKVNNGLTYSISCLKKYPIVAHLQLTQIERSPLAAAVDESM
jgi:PhoH-like ATPase